MKVSNIMTKDVITVTKDTSLKDAAGLLAKFRIHGMPVVDENKKVVGIITESDFFTKDTSNIYLPDFLEFINKKGKGDLSGSKRQESGKNTKVSDIMTGQCMTVGQDLPVENLVFQFKENSFNSMPVVDEVGNLVGVVTIMDVIKLL